MPLVEIIRGKETTDENVSTIFNLCKKLGKTPIVVNDGPGFLVNRILVPYMVEAVALLEEGNDAAHIDAVMRKFGMPMGPFELFDEVGIDVAYKVAKILQDFMSDRMAESDLLPKMIEDNRLGKKAGKGFYRHAGKKREFDSYINTLVIKKDGHIYDDSTLINRMVYSMINEASRCLEDKIATKPRDVDVGMIFGTGFAPFRGGLLKFADSEGSKKVVDTLQKFVEEFGARFTPGKYLTKLAEGDGKFYN
jgi:3-hydroxyacyl-CoA dehydrogenase/enoyl-CoA hydratase/3-hydroxybutyryl-CoA epimerase